jgi:hypothetical protein
MRVTEAVSCALVSHRLLRLTYRTGGGGGRKRATVEPIRLRTAAGLQYLDAFRREDGALRTYALHRCVEARALQGTFVPRPVPPRTAFGALEGAARAVHVRFAPRGRELHRRAGLAPVATRGAPFRRCAGLDGDGVWARGVPRLGDVLVTVGRAQNTRGLA